MKKIVIFNLNIRENKENLIKMHILYRNIINNNNGTC